ncbi:MAG TPA: SMC-Scp complex subunit ScpB [Sedimentisphaerales bacterium]|nr:SMC-Scp complex subunit ScpB [Sedimentisphaerales bacterium]HRS10643.1 SMC-Scp complex subunit ScpB [Sedimentisphaerales bacterium]HRV47348.1 SMC-Scp complex subunit ScpB [Sedimentisphaerales bacterium]
MTGQTRETPAEECFEDIPPATQGRDTLDIEAEPAAEGEGQDGGTDDDPRQEVTDDTDTEVVEDGSRPAENTEETPTVESVIEAILFASEEPLSDSRLAGIVETTTKQVRDCIASLNEKYQRNHNAFRIEQIAGGHQMLTLPMYHTWLKKLLKARSDNKLSPAAMETLAIIAYKQPVIRVDIEAIRGVAVGEVIRSLMYKGLVKIVGRAEILGRPMLYGTTKKFLEVFGLNSLKDLPKVEELKKPD